MASLTRDQHRKFLDLACQLSPENLHCDGEISPKMAERKYWILMAEWKALEAEIGRKVSEDEVWAQRMDDIYQR